MKDDAGRIHEYYNGIAEGVRMYAHWKSGEQFVGTTGKTLKQALKEIEEERQEALGK
jgi:hypothetical protein